MNDRAYLSIGEVLGLLQDEFPDVTISKIRFLESQGLIDPERTPSGYRKFYDADIERLRFILREQREHFLPLKVIKDRLETNGEAGRAAGAVAGRRPRPTPEDRARRRRRSRPAAAGERRRPGPRRRRGDGRRAGDAARRRQPDLRPAVRGDGPQPARARPRWSATGW